MYVDNKSVFYNNTLTESNLKKKSNSIAYHAVREGVATGEWITGYGTTDTNLLVLLTKPVPVGKRSTVLSGELFIIFDCIGCGFSLLGSFPHR